MTAAAVTKNATCPFCSLLCDDLTVAARGNRLHISDNVCRLAQRGFAVPAPPAQARLDNAPVTVECAVAAAARILGKSRKPLIAGLGADVNGIRAALQLAEQTGARLWHSQERHAVNNLDAVYARGSILTTLAEVKNRADVIIFVGEHVTRRHPRFIERFINAPHSLFVGNRRNLACLGRLGRQEAKECAAHSPVTLGGRGAEIADNLALLRAWLAEPRLLNQRNVPAAKRRRLEQVATMIRKAQYGVFVWSAAALPPQHADLVIGSVLDLVRELNARQRFAGLSLGGNDGGASFQNAATWQTGFPAGLEFRDGSPHRNAAMDDPLSDADCLLWISSFADAPPPDLQVPTIALSPYRSVGAGADVYIPTGTPGIDHAGVQFRTDSVVSLPLKKLRDNGSAGAAEIISNISARLRRGRP